MRTSSTIRVFVLLCTVFTLSLSSLIDSSCRVCGQNVEGASDEAADQSWQYRYNQNTTIWTVETSIPQLKTTVHQYNDLEGYSRQGCEFFSFDIPASGPLYLGADVPSGALKANVLPSLYIKSDRTGYKLFLRVILPNSFNQKNEPLSFWLEGTVYSTVNRWQQLRVEKPLEQLENQVRLLSAEQSLRINTDNAFYDKLYLNLEGSKGPVKVWIDDLEINGYKAISSSQALAAGRLNAESDSANRSSDAANAAEGANPPNSTDGANAPLPLVVTPIPGANSPDTGGAEATLDPGSPTADNSGENSGADPSFNNNGSRPLARPSYPGRENISEEHAAPSSTPISGLPDGSPSGSASGSPSDFAPSATLPPISASGAPGHGALSNSGISRPGTGGQTAAEPAAGPATPKIRANGSLLYINDNVFFPQGIRYRGEPLSLFRDLGFNTVWLTSPPTKELQEEARQAGLWIIAAPPLDEMTSDDPQTVPVIGDRYPRVLAWDLGPVDKRNLSLDQVREIRERIERADNLGPRPIICQTHKDLFDYSRNCNIVLIEKSVIYSTLSFRRYLQWETEMPLLMRNSLPLWSVVSTQPDSDLRKQWQLMFPNDSYPSSFPVEQLFLQTIISLSGKRGLLFESYTPLSNNDIDTQNRRKSLELINYFIETIDSFLAKGKTTILEDQNDPKRTILTIKVPERGVIAIPLYLEEDAQYVVNGMSSNGATIIVPGIPSTYQPYHMSPNGLEPVNSSRQAGGVRFAIENQEPVSFYLLSRDHTVISHMSNRLRKYGPRIAELKGELTQWRLANIRQWIDFKRATADELKMLDQAQQMLQLAQSSMAQKAYSNAYNYANRAAQTINSLEYIYWAKGSSTSQTPNTHPAAVCLRSIRLYHQWQQSSLNYTFSENLLNGGNFESDDIFKTGAWKNVCDQNLPVYAAVELSPEAAHTGKYGLRMLSWAKSQSLDENPRLLVKPPLKLIVPTIKVNPGQVVRISLSLNIPHPITGTLDGLIIREEGSGEILQARISKTLNWDRVSMFRAADESGEIRLSLELTGYGEAWIDNVWIQSVVPRKPNEPGGVQ